MWRGRAVVDGVVMITHAEVNERANRLFAAGMGELEMVFRVATMRQWQQVGLDAAEVDHLLMAVPLRDCEVRHAR